MADDNVKDDPKVDPPEDDEEPEEEYEAPDQESWTKTTAALEKANAEAKKWRMRATGKDEKWKPPAPPKPADPPAKDEDKAPKVDVAAERRAAEEATAAKFKAPMVRTAARSALEDAGLILPPGKDKRDAAFTRATRLIDMSEVDVDDDGDISGLDDQVRSIKRDYPELFAKKGARTIDAGAGAGGNGSGGGEKTSASKLAAMITGGSR